jgi:hypothetical protein
MAPLTGYAKATTSLVDAQCIVTYSTSTPLLFPDKPQVRADCRACGTPLSRAVGE